MIKQVLVHHTTIAFMFLGLITAVGYLLAEIIN
jgi:hypothetical protein